jgi:hypothetical protein
MYIFFKTTEVPDVLTKAYQTSKLLANCILVTMSLELREKPTLWGGRHKKNVKLKCSKFRDRSIHSDKNGIKSSLDCPLNFLFSQGYKILFLNLNVVFFSILCGFLPYKV